MYYYERPQAPVAGMGSAPGCVTVPWVDANGVSGQGELCGAGGDCGCVKCVQDALNRLGYGPVTVTGLPGEQTYAALVRYHEVKGIPLDAAYDAATCAALAADYAAATGALVAAPRMQVSRTSLQKLTKKVATTQRGSQAPADEPPPPPPVDEGWWSSQPTGTKIAIIASGVALVGAIGYVALAPEEACHPEPSPPKRAWRASQRECPPSAAT